MPRGAGERQVGQRYHVGAGTEGGIHEPHRSLLLGDRRGHFITTQLSQPCLLLAETKQFFEDLAFHATLDVLPALAVLLAHPMGMHRLGPQHWLLSDVCRPHTVLAHGRVPRREFWAGLLRSSLSYLPVLVPLLPLGQAAGKLERASHSTLGVRPEAMQPNLERFVDVLPFSWLSAGRARPAPVCQPQLCSLERSQRSCKVMIVISGGAALTRR
mmetsp:Transcript_178694/g.572800  ORF Transcript_178694/g.572800 Transcript_178694/m.572800 type:complete len:214 (+) Transcript_178694:347-988(+)